MKKNNLKVWFIEPHDTQYVVFKDDSKRQIINVGRRWGKDVLVKNKIQYAILNNKNVVLIEHNFFEIKSKIEIFQTVFKYIQPTLQPIKSKNGGIFKLNFSNGNSITLLTSDNINKLNDLDYDLLVVNEYDYIKKLKKNINNIDKKNGDVILIGTGKENGLWDILKENPNWTKHTYSSFDNPHLLEYLDEDSN